MRRSHPAVIAFVLGLALLGVGIILGVGLFWVAGIVIMIGAPVATVISAADPRPIEAPDDDEEEPDDDEGTIL
jgi:hypothetical protein